MKFLQSSEAFWLAYCWCLTLAKEWPFSQKTNSPVPCILIHDYQPLEVTAYFLYPFLPQVRYPLTRHQNWQKLKCFSSFSSFTPLQQFHGLWMPLSKRLVSVSRSDAPHWSTFQFRFDPLLFLRLLDAWVLELSLLRSSWNLLKLPPSLSCQALHIDMAVLFSIYYCRDIGNFNQDLVNASVILLKTTLNHEAEAI